MKLLKIALALALTAQPFIAPSYAALSTTPSFKSYAIQGDLASVAYGNGKYVALGNGKLLTSTNGSTWTYSTASITGTLKSVAYKAANTTFYVMTFDSAAKTTNFYSSTDGLAWTKISTISSGGLATYGSTFSQANGMFFATGKNLIYWSADAKTWTLFSLGTTSPGYNTTFLNIAYGNSKYVVTTEDAALNNGTWTSADGKTWTAGGSLWSQARPNISFGNGTFMAFAGATVKSSTNGTTWTNALVPVTTPAASISSVVYNAGWKAFDANGAIWSSSTGALNTWTQNAAANTNVAAPKFNAGVVTSGTTYVGVGQTGSIATSTNLTAWTIVNSTETDLGYRFAASNGTKILISDIYGIKASTDGIAWQDATIPASVLAQFPGQVDFSYQNIKYINGYFYAFVYYIQDGGLKVWRSADAVTWTTFSLGYWNEDFPIDVAALSNGLHVVLHQNGIATPFTDFNNWQASVSIGATAPVVTLANPVVAITSNGTKFFAVCTNGAVVSSTDGVTWAASGTTAAGATSIAYANSKLVVATSTGLYTSSTGTSWTKNALAIPAPVTGNNTRKLSVANGKFYFTTNNGYVAASSDAATWTVITKATTNTVCQVASNSVVYVGATADEANTINGTILISK